MMNLHDVGRPFRTIARRTLTKLVENLPPNAKRSVMEALVAGPHCYDLFRAIGNRYHVRDIGVMGEYGIIEGSLVDGGVIAGYAKVPPESLDHGWTLPFESNHFLANFFREHQA